MMMMMMLLLFVVVWEGGECGEKQMCVCVHVCVCVCECVRACACEEKSFAQTSGECMAHRIATGSGSHPHSVVAPRAANGRGLAGRIGPSLTAEKLVQVGGGRGIEVMMTMTAAPPHTPTTLSRPPLSFSVSVSVSVSVCLCRCLSLSLSFSFSVCLCLCLCL